MEGTTRRDAQRTTVATQCFGVGKTIHGCVAEVDFSTLVTKGEDGA